MRTESKYSVLVIDDHPLIVRGVKMLLDEMDVMFSSIDCVTHSEAAISTMQRQSYDLYIVDIEMPDVNGFELLGEIWKTNKAARIIVYTIHEELWFLRQMEKYEVNAIVSKSLDTDILKQTVKVVLTGEDEENNLFLSQARKVVHDSLWGNALSKSEIKVLQYIAQGLKTTEIAEKMFVTKNTVQTHRQHINEKLGTDNVAGMIMEGLKRGLVNVE